MRSAKLLVLIDKLEEELEERNIYFVPSFRLLRNEIDSFYRQEFAALLSEAALKARVAQESAGRGLLDSR